MEKTPYSNRSYRLFVLALLTLVYMFNFLDRQLLVILQEPIKQELGLSDTQLGLLSGFAFALVHVTFGLPLAQLAERWGRRSVVAISLATWSLMTALSGMVSSFTQLLLARTAVGIGEAGGSPPSHSIISDIFPPSRRATALAVYSMGLNFGILLGFLLGGWINEFFGWRKAFIVIGLPGLALAIIVRFTVVEPPKGFSEGLQKVERPPEFFETLSTLWQKRSFRHLALAAGLQSLVVYAILNWLPSFMIRTHAMGTGELGTWLALSAGVGGAFGTFSGGWISDRLANRDLRAYVLVPAASFLLSIPLMYFVLSVANPTTALSIYIVPAVLQTIYLGPVLAATHALVGARARAVGSAIMIFVANLIGLGLGPVVVGSISDLLQPSLGAASLRYALLTVISLAGVWCIVHYILSAQTIIEDIDATRSGFSRD